MRVEADEGPPLTVIRLAPSFPLMCHPPLVSLTGARAIFAGVLLACLGGVSQAAPPTDILLSNNTALEWCPPETVVGILSAVDADVGDTHVFTLVSGAGSDHNSGAKIVGNELRLRYGFDRDFEVFGSLNFKCRVRARDAGGAFVEKAFVLLMLDDREEDADGDGLTEAQEEDIHGTSDVVFDFDNDGVGDGAEVRGNASPTDPLDWPQMAIVGWGNTAGGVRAVPDGSGFLALATGEDHSLALHSDGTIDAWGGQGSYGQLTVPAGLTDVIGISAGGDYWIDDTAYSVAVRNDGTVALWGVDHDGRMTPPAGLGDVISVSAGRTRCLALKNNGTVVEWGFIPHDGSAVPAGLSGITAVAAGGFHSLALRSDGAVVEWGSRFDGENWSPAKAPAGLADVVALAAGRLHSLALRADGTVVAWGHNSHGQLNVPAGLTDVVAIAGGGFHSLALKADGSVIAWGLNSHGQSAVPLSAGAGIRQISAGNFHSLALRHQTGYPAITSAPKVFGTPGVLLEHQIVVENATPAGFSAAGLPEGLALDPLTGLLSGTPAGPARQSVRIIAETDQGLLSQSLWLGISTGVAPDAITITPGAIAENAANGASAGFLTASDPDEGDSHTYELVDGAGATDNFRFRIEGGQLLAMGPLVRDHETNPAPFSVRIRARDASLNPFDAILTIAFLDDMTEDADGDGLNEAQELALGTSDANADSDGDGFGDRFESLRGTNPASSASFPSGRILIGWGDGADGRIQPQPGVADFIDLSAGAGHSLALTSAGLVAAWGSDEHGQSSVPPALTTVIAADAGDFHSLALRADGTVAAWGNNDVGQTDVPPGLTAVAISAGGYHNLALLADGTVTAWGDNRYGQCDVPAGLADVVAVSAGGFHSLALRGDGSLIAWGSDWQGVSTVPMGLTGVTGISAGGYHNVVMLHDGSVRAWGANDYGQCSVPENLGPVTAISAGWEHTLALKTNGTPAAWGANDAGQCVIPAEATAIRRIAAGDLHNLALRQTSGFPGIPAMPMLRSWPGEGFSAVIPVQNATPSAFAAMGLPENVGIDSVTGVIAGPSGSGWKRSVRVSAATNAGSFSTLVWIDTTVGVAPTDILLSPSSVMENSAAGTVVGSLTVIDPNAGDTHGLRLSYSPEGPDDFRFEIIGTQLRVRVPLTADHDLGVTSLNIRVSATDSAGNRFGKNLIIQLLDDRLEDADGDGFNEQTEEDLLGTSDLVADDFNMADADKDGVASLIEHAFNLNPKVAGPPVRLVPGAGSTAGLPAITFVPTGGGQSRLRLEYLRRAGAGMNYTPEFGNSPATMLPAANAVSVSPVSPGWERCIVEDIAAFPGSAKRFARVRVTW
jgi:alpha-tubulin suppressor-like RCC1 family protein